MIKTFECTDTETLFHGRRVACFANIAAVAERKLQQIDSAETLESLRSPPGNRLEALKGDRAGSTAFASTINGGCASASMAVMRSMWK